MNDDPNTNFQDVNEQFYKDTTAVPDASPVAPATMAPVSANPAPAGISLMAEDEQSFTVAGPNGVQTFPKNFQDIERAGDLHQNLYNNAKANAEFQAAKMAPAMTGPAITAPALSSSAPRAPAQEPSSIKPMDGNGAKPAPKPSTESSSGARSGGGAQLVNITETTRNQYGKEDMRLFKEAEKSVINKEIAKMDAETALHTAQQTLADRQAMENAKFIDEETQRRHAEDTAKGERLAKYNSAKEQFGGLRVDARRLWNDASTGDKLMATVAMALGGMGNALQGRAGNPAWEIIDKNIDRDIDEQKTNINQKGRELDAERTAYQDFLQATGDERAARLATKELAMQKIASEFESKIGAATNAAQRASLEAGLAGVQEKQAQYAMEMNKVLVNTKPQVVTGRPGEGKVEDKVLLDIVDQETGLDSMADIVKTLEAGKTESGVIENWKQEAARYLNLPADTDSAVLKQKMAEQKNTYVTKMFGASLTATEKTAAEAAVAMFGDDPVRAAAMLRSTLDGATKRAANQRATLEEAGRNLPETRSTHLKSYRQTFEKQR